MPAGVSNWGGYAVACGLYLLQLCPAHQRYLRRGLGLEQPAPQEQLHHWRDNLPSVHKVTLYSQTLASYKAVFLNWWVATPIVVAVCMCF